jgi:protein TonB
MFAMVRDGTMLKVRIKTTAGQPVLGRAAIDTVRHAQPLPTVPAALAAPLHVILPVAFGASE